MTDTQAEIERHLWAAIDLMAATLVEPDPKIWGHLLVYAPKDRIANEIAALTDYVEQAVRERDAANASHVALAKHCADLGREIERLRQDLKEVECELNAATDGKYLPHRWSAAPINDSRNQDWD